MNWNSEWHINSFQNFWTTCIPWHTHFRLRNWAVSMGHYHSLKYPYGVLAQKKTLQEDVWKILTYSGYSCPPFLAERWGSISSTFLGWLRVSSFTILVCNQKYQWMLQPKNNERRHTIRIPLCWLIPFSLEQGGVYVFGILTSAFTSPGLKTESIWAAILCTYRQAGSWRAPESISRGQRSYLFGWLPTEMP